MRLITGNLWDARELAGAHLIAVTANNTLKQDGRLVMGAGAAKEAVERYPGLDQEAGEAVAAFAAHHGHREYGFLPLRWETVGARMFPRLGIFQTKDDPRLPSDLDLIVRSCGALRRWLMSAAPSGTVVAVNFPGIGKGSLKRSDVLPVISRELPNNVVVFELETPEALSEAHRALIAALARCRFQPGSFPKRFMRSLEGRTEALTPKQAAALENLRRQFRRQLHQIAPALVADLAEPPPAPSRDEQAKLAEWERAAKTWAKNGE